MTDRQWIIFSMWAVETYGMDSEEVDAAFVEAGHPPDYKQIGIVEAQKAVMNYKIRRNFSKN